MLVSRTSNACSAEIFIADVAVAQEDASHGAPLTFPHFDGVMVL